MVQWKYPTAIATGTESTPLDVTIDQDPQPAPPQKGGAVPLKRITVQIHQRYVCEILAFRFVWSSVHHSEARYSLDCVRPRHSRSRTSDENYEPLMHQWQSSRLQPIILPVKVLLTGIRTFTAIGPPYKLQFYGQANDTVPRLLNDPYDNLIQPIANQHCSDIDFCDKVYRGHEHYCAIEISCPLSLTVFVECLTELDKKLGAIMKEQFREKFPRY